MSTKLDCLYSGEIVVIKGVQPCSWCFKPSSQFHGMMRYETHYLRDGMDIYMPGSVFVTDSIVCPDCHWKLSE